MRKDKSARRASAAAAAACTLDQDKGVSEIGRAFLSRCYQSADLEGVLPGWAPFHDLPMDAVLQISS